MKKLFFLAVLFFLANSIHAQKIHFGLKGGLLRTNQMYDRLIVQETLFFLENVMFPAGNVAVSGNHQARIGVGISAFAEIFPYKSGNISFILGVGYRQKGFTTDMVNRLGGVLPPLQEKSNNRFDCLSISLAERFYIKTFYITIGGYYDYLFNYRVHPEYDYVYSHYKKAEISPFICFGKTIPVNQSALQIEFELNPSFKNMLDFENFFAGRYNSSIKNFIYSLNASYRF
jgi:hypothetical protein